MWARPVSDRARAEPADPRGRARGSLLRTHCRSGGPEPASPPVPPSADEGTGTPRGRAAVPAPPTQLDRRFGVLEPPAVLAQGALRECCRAWGLQVPKGVSAGGFGAAEPALPAGIWQGVRERGKELGVGAVAGHSVAAGRADLQAERSEDQSHFSARAKPPSLLSDPQLWWSGSSPSASLETTRETQVSEHMGRRCRPVRLHQGCCSLSSAACRE